MEIGKSLIVSILFLGCTQDIPPKDMQLDDFDEYDYSMQTDEEYYEELPPPVLISPPTYGEPPQLPDRETPYQDRLIPRPQPEPPPCVVCGMVK